MTIEEATRKAMLSMHSVSEANASKLVKLVERARDRALAWIKEHEGQMNDPDVARRISAERQFAASYSKAIQGEPHLRGGGIGQSIQNSSKPILKQGYKAGYVVSTQELRGQVQHKVPLFSMRSAQFFAEYQFQLSGVVNRLNSDLVSNIRKEILAGLIEGEGTDKIAKRLSSTGLARGRFNVLMTRCRLIAQDQVARAFNAGKRDYYQDAGVSYVKVVGGTQPCGECAKYEDQIFRLEEAPIFPLHPRCTHTLVAVRVKGFGIGLQ